MTAGVLERPVTLVGTGQEEMHASCPVCWPEPQIQPGEVALCGHKYRLDEASYDSATTCFFCLATDYCSVCGN